MQELNNSINKIYMSGIYRTFNPNKQINKNKLSSQQLVELSSNLNTYMYMMQISTDKENLSITPHSIWIPWIKPKYKQQLKQQKVP